MLEESISLAITNYNREELLIESFVNVLNDGRIKEIVISDDHSDSFLYERLCAYFSKRGEVKMFRNDENVNMSLNKKLAIERCQPGFVLILDSDNIVYPDYLTALYKLSTLDDNTIYLPCFAEPNFDFRVYSGLIISKDNVAKRMDEAMFRVMLNCCNYVVNRDSYIRRYQHNPNILGADTIHFAYNWLKDGGLMYVVPEMQYYHRVEHNHENEPKSGFLKDVHKNMADAQHYETLIRQLI